MAGLDTPAGDGRTELSEEDREGLIPSYVSTLGDLYVAEQRNIIQGLRRTPPAVEVLLDDQYLRAFHRALFGDVWRWAGKYRTRETNIGIEPTSIAPAVRLLVDDARMWIEHDVYEPDALVARFHHQLVRIHPFPNGNGRHSRLAADDLLAALGRPRFSWGAGLGLDANELRSRYRSALRRADGDADDIHPLLDFARG